PLPPVAPSLHHRQSELLQIQRRLIWLGALLFLGLAGVVARLWYLQVLEGERYQHLANRNIYRVVRLPALRGAIRDRNGVVLAGNRPAYDLVAIPEDLADRRHCPPALRRLFPEEADRFDALLARARKRRIPSFRPVVLKEDLPWEQMAQVERLAPEMPGITIRPVPVRHYPEGSLAAHLLGYVGKISERQLASPDYAGYHATDEVGQSGVERVYERILRGRDGHKLIQVDSLGREQRVLSVEPPQAGADLYLTLDARLQREAERLLGERTGAVVALDPRSGAVLALASHPTFDPNLFAAGLGGEQWRRLRRDPTVPLMDRAIQGQYPPGSVFKLVLAAAALEEDLGNVQFFCDGGLEYHGRRYRCWKRWGHGLTDLRRSLVESCDVFYYELGLRLGIDRIARYARRLGLGRPTGIDLPGEASGLIPDRAWKRRRHHEPWWGGETLSASIGQGFVLATPVQLARMVAAIADRGILRRPYVAAAAGRGPTPEPLGRAKAVGVLPLSVAHLESLRAAMEAAVMGRHGTGRRARVKGIRVAGKTGTAQVVGMEEQAAEAKGKRRHRDHALFVCFAPVEAPTIAIAVVVEHGGHGGESAAPIAGALLDYYFRHPEMAGAGVAAGPPGGRG
ncbi:MAG: penicillin-binding protein 2, partial [Nitrospirae bacterium]